MIWRLLCTIGRLTIHGRADELYRLNHEARVVRKENVRLVGERDRAVAERNAARLQLEQVTANYGLLLDVDAGIVPSTVPKEWAP